MIHKATIRTDKGPIHFEIDDSFSGKKIVALNATLDDFKARPCKLPGGGDGVEYPSRTIKDCTNIDGCIYLHKGHVPDTEMVRLIGMFLEVLKDKKLWKHEMPKLLNI